MPAAWKLVAWLAMLLAASVPGLAHAQMPPRIQAALFWETQAPAPGKRVQVAIRMTPERGWHGYWINPGDSGLPVTVEWQAPAGLSFGELRHPAPSLLDVQGIASYVHDGPFSLLATLTVPSGLKPGTALPIKARLNWLACSDSLCVPESASLSTTLRVGDGAPDPQGSAIVRQAAAAVPAPLPGTTISMRGGEWIIDIPRGAHIDPGKARLYPAGDGWFTATAAQTTARTDAGLRVSVAALEGAPKGTFSGVISDGRSAYAIEATKASGAPPPAPASQALESTSEGDPSGTATDAALTAAAPEVAAPALAMATTPETSGLLLTSLIGALIGGLLLNLMPCVFPILSLKALSLARSGADRAEARREGLGYAAGSIATAALLGGILIVLKAAGQEVGWSFSFNPLRWCCCCSC